MQLDGQRGIAAGAAQDHLTTEHDADDGVIDVANNWTIVDEEEVSNARKTFEGVVFIDADGFIGKIAAGGDDGGTEGGHEQMVEGVGGEHDPQVGVAGSDRAKRGGRRSAAAGLR